ncbi:unnamed protein product [Penicillium salamii]|uniref:BZIP domain-containing protein n=1 Tax=Penicillium salamii TaxID=1612424 RepID=A0A9W4J9P4_9EURO|nr:unnamed protein product [Penicillium salamii]CAG8384289.1 unnamed protein product [Penicillium salamii]
MDYSYYNEPRSQPYSLYGLPTPNQQPPQDEAFAPLVSSLTSLALTPHSDSTPPNPLSRHRIHRQSLSPSTQSQATPTTNTQTPSHSMATNPTSQTPSEAAAKKKTQCQRKASAKPRIARRIQRAFRERKERHVKDLEDKVNNLETASDTLHADNERLKRELAKYTTENEILRATSNTNRAHGNINESPEPTVTGPMRYSPTDFYTSLVPDGPALPRSPQHRVTVCQITGEKLLDAGATWDLIQGHELFKRGQVDIANVTEILKGMAQCDGQGPAYKEGQVRRAIEESAAMDRDELI